MTLSQRQALVTAGATTLAVLLAFSLHVQNPWWAGISAFIVSQTSSEGLLTKAALRVVGTTFGCLVAAFLAVQLAGQPIQQVIATIGIFTLGIYKRYTAQYAYAWFLGCITAALFLVVSVNSPDVVLTDTVYRVVEISLGVLIAATVGVCCHPFVHVDVPPPPEPTLPTDRATHLAALEVGLLGGIMFVLVGAVLNSLAFPSLTQVLVSLAVILAPSVAATRDTARRRAFGCLIGGLSGIVLIMLSVDFLALWAFLFFGILALFAVHHHSSHPEAYVGTQAGVTFIVACVTGNGQVTDITSATHRVVAITVTALLVWLASWLVAPWLPVRQDESVSGAPEQKESPPAR